LSLRTIKPNLQKQKAKTLNSSEAEGLLPTGYSIQPAGWRDLTALRRLEKLCFPKDAWPLFELLGVLVWPEIWRFKAVGKAGEMVGFVAGQEIDGAGWIITLAVHPEHRRQGLGYALLSTCENAMPHTTLKLAVRASNRAAQMLYRTAGYEVVGRWEKYYTDREDALIMEKRRRKR